MSRDLAASAHESIIDPTAFAARIETAARAGGFGWSISARPPACRNCDHKTHARPATALVEIAETAKLSITIDEAEVPVTELVDGACEILGLEPLHVANENRFVCILPHAQADPASQILQRAASASIPRLIGHV